ARIARPRQQALGGEHLVEQIAAGNGRGRRSLSGRHLCTEPCGSSAAYGHSTDGRAERPEELAARGAASPVVFVGHLGLPRRACSDDKSERGAVTRRALYPATRGP